MNRTAINEDRLNQFYASPDQINKTYIRLKDQEAIHAARVLRKGVGDTIVVTDGNGTRYRGKIESISKNEVLAAIHKKEEFIKPKPAVILALGLIKKRNRLEFSVEKATELGASEIILFRGDHSEPFKVRMDRIEASVMSAMKQSLRVYLPEVRPVKSLDSIINGEEQDTLILHANQEGNVTDYKLSDNIKRIVMVVGPEGGLSVSEQALLKKAGAVGLRLGDYRLRAETAAMVMTSRFGNSAAEVRLPQ